MGTPQTLADQLSEAQADLAAALGAEQRALEKAGDYRAMAAEQETRAAEQQYLLAEVQQRRQARGYAAQANELRERVRKLCTELDSEITAARDALTLMSRLILPAVASEGTDDMIDFAEGGPA